MKTLRSFSSLLILGGALAGAMLTGCQQDPNSTGAPAMQLPLSNPHGGGGSTAAAHPNWVFEATNTVHGHTYSCISVSDSEGTNLTPIYTSSVSGHRTLFATWSASGASVSFVEMPGLTSNSWYSGSSYGNYAIKAVDVTVSNGVVSSSNTPRTLYSVTSSDQKKILSQAWCPATSGSGAGKIAFLEVTPTTSTIYLISTSGGTPSAIYTVTNTDNRIGGNTLAWKNDGTELAFTQGSGTNVSDANVVCSIKIIDLSGNIVTSLLDGTRHIGELQWSNGGPEQITFEGADVAGPLLYSDCYEAVVSTTDGSTATATKLLTGGAGVYAYGVYWSPDNSELSYESAGAAVYKLDRASGVSTRVSSATHIGDWK